MKKTGTIKTKVFAGVIAAVCAVSAISTGAIIGASAHSSASAPVIESRTSRKNPRGFESPDNTKKGSQRLSDFLFFSVPKGIRTPDLSLRRRTLYPAELLAQLFICLIIISYIGQIVNTKSCNMLIQHKTPVGNSE